MAGYRLTEAAQYDLDQLYEYGISTFGLYQADAYYDGLLTCLNRVARFPLAYPDVENIRTNYRRAPYKSHSVYYRIEDNKEVVIVRILGKQDISVEATTF